MLNSKYGAMKTKIIGSKGKAAEGIFKIFKRLGGKKELKWKPRLVA